jgi:hypothetical protein
MRMELRTYRKRVEIMNRDCYLYLQLILAQSVLQGFDLLHVISPGKG